MVDLIRIDLKKMWILKRQELFLLLVMETIGGIGGIVLSIILKTEIRAYELVFLLSLSLVFCVIYFAGFIFFANDFSIAVKMGCSRKKYIIMNTIYTVLEMIVIFVYAQCFALIGETIQQTIVNPFAYQTMEIFSIPSVYWMFIELITFILVIEHLFGSIYIRFGKLAFWILWVIWMFAVIGIPNFISRISGNVIMSIKKVGSLLQTVIYGSQPASILFYMIVVICVLGIAYQMIQKVDIK